MSQRLSLWACHRLFLPRVTVQRDPDDMQSIVPDSKFRNLFDAQRGGQGR
jgi:hypothetical protein